MDLYDDLDTKQRAGQIDGWSSGIKLLQTQLALKKAVVPPAVKKEQSKRATLLAPVMLLKTKNKNNNVDDIFQKNEAHKTQQPLKKQKTSFAAPPLAPPNKAANDYNWDVVDEYDPLWPNEYEKLIKERRERDAERSRERERNRDDRKRRNTRYNENDSPSGKHTGFAGRSDDIDNYNKSPPAAQTRSGGAAIAPPPSLQESTPIIPAFQNNNASASYGSSSVAAKIMAKYGFKDGQGLGKLEQGMSIALQVEKTSKRGGRIIHENEIMQPPGVTSSPPPQQNTMQAPQPQTQPSQSPSQSQSQSQLQPSKEELSITEIMKAPSKVVLLRNMVGAGDVDSELEGEVKDECNTKYGDVVSVTINEVANVTPEEAVRIFVEFKRIESAIKAVVDLNGRFFGGRQVKAGFFAFDKYRNNQLTD